MPTQLVSAWLIAITATAGVTDWRTGKIPNWLTLPSLALAPLGHLAFAGLSSSGASLGGALLSALVPGLLYRASRGEAIGGGDLKLFAALGAIAGAETGIEIQLLAFALVALLACVRLTFQGKLARIFANAGRLLVSPLLPARFRRPIEPEALTTLRLGPFIAVAAAVLVTLERSELLP